MQKSEVKTNILNNDIKIRNEYLDYLKGFAIFLVVLGHCTVDKTTFWLIYRFHMPLFFCISGYLFKGNQNFKKFFIKKIKTLILPFTIFFIISYAISIIFLDLKMPFSKMIEFFFLNGKYCSGVSNWAIWYLPLFFISSNIFYFISKLKNRFYFILLLITLALITVPFNNFLMEVTTNGFIPFSIQVLPVSLFYMGIGFIYNSFKEHHLSNHNIHNKKSHIICLFLFGLGILLSINNSDQIINITTYNYIFAALLIIPLIIAVTKDNKNKIMTYLGKNTLIILGLHRIIIACFEYYGWIDFLNKYHITSDVSALLLAIIVIAIICITNETINYLKTKLKILSNKLNSSI